MIPPIETRVFSAQIASPGDSREKFVYHPIETSV